MFFSLAVPEILSCDVGDKSQFESVPISYECTAHGVPNPEVQWLHDGKPITADKRIKITDNGVSSFFFYLS